MQYKITGKRGSMLVSEKEGKAFRIGDFTNLTGDVISIKKVMPQKKKTAKRKQPTSIFGTGVRIRMPKF